MRFAGAEVMEYDCPDGMGTCPNCEDKCLTWVDSHDTENVLRCTGCGFTDVWVEPDVAFDIALPKYEA